MRTHLILLLAMVLLRPDPVEARARRGGGGWLGGRRALRLAQPLISGCSELSLTEEAIELDAETHDLDDPISAHDSDATVWARKRGRYLELRYHSSGSGVDAGQYSATWRVNLKGGCTAVGLEYKCCVSNRETGWRFTAYKRALPDDKEQWLLAKLAGYTFGKPDVVGFAASQLMAARERCSSSWPKNGWTLFGPLKAAQPEHPGLPRGSPTTLWLRGPLRPQQATKESKEQRLVESQVLALTRSVRGPARKRKQGPHQLYVTSLGGRLGAGVVAVYNTRTRKHRWVLSTDGCIAGKIAWYGGAGALLFGDAQPVHPSLRDESVSNDFVIDLASGLTYKLLVDPAWSISEVKGGQLVVERRGKEPLRIPLSAIQARLKQPGR